MFTVPTSARELPENRFAFEFDGETYDVPLFKFAPVEAAIAFEEGRYTEGLLLCADKPDVAKLLRGLDREQLRALDVAWSAASKVSPGESEGSADS